MGAPLLVEDRLGPRVDDDLVVDGVDAELEQVDDLARVHAELVVLVEEYLPRRLGGAHLVRVRVRVRDRVRISVGVRVRVRSARCRACPAWRAGRSTRPG